MTERTVCPACRGAGLLATPGPCKVCDGEGTMVAEMLMVEMTEQMAGVRCKYCGVRGRIVAHWKVEVKPPGTFSLSGNTMKVPALWWPYATCGACGHESRGQDVTKGKAGQ